MLRFFKNAKLSPGRTRFSLPIKMNTTGSPQFIHLFSKQTKFHLILSEKLMTTPLWQNWTFTYFQNKHVLTITISIFYRLAEEDIQRLRAMDPPPKHPRLLRQDNLELKRQSSGPKLRASSPIDQEQGPLIGKKQVNFFDTLFITDSPLYEGNIQSKLKISFQAKKSCFAKLSKNGSS